MRTDLAVESTGRCGCKVRTFHNPLQAQYPLPGMVSMARRCSRHSGNDGAQWVGIFVPYKAAQC